MSDESPDLEALRKRLEEEESAYAAALAALDELAAFQLPLEALPNLPRQVERLNALWEAPPPPEAGGLSGHHQRTVWRVMAPAVQRQQEFNSVLVQLLNGYVSQTARLDARLREVAAALVRYLQRVLPVVDARDRLSTALATTRSELILESFDRRQESLGRRIEGLLAVRDRLEALSEEVRGLRDALAAPPPPEVAAAASRAAETASYAAFENRYRGSREEIRERLAAYVPAFEGLAPVADLGCGRGEFLGLLRDKGIAGLGVEASAHAAQACRQLGLDVVEGDLLAFLGERGDASLGGVFAAQVAEHLPPSALQSLLREAHRVLRAEGLLILETVNPRSVVGLLEVFNRDLTHERPLHPETLSFLAAAAGFTDVRVEYRSPVDAASRLQPVPGDGLPQRAVQALNENVGRLNALIYGPQEYALLARR